MLEGNPWNSNRVEIRSRLATHGVPFDALNVGGYAGIGDAAQKAAKIASDYDAFLTKRAEIVLSALTELCSGKNWLGMAIGASY